MFIKTPSPCEEILQEIFFYLAIFARLLAGKLCYQDFLSRIALIFVTSAILFSE